MLETILARLHNWFEVAKYAGTYTISSGTLTFDQLQPGQYFRIMGSVFNDGLHQYPATDLTDETFTGQIWALAVPKQVRDLAVEIETWVEKNPVTDKTSESFGGYSYTRATNGKGGPMEWTDVFRSKLNPWRKLS